MASAETTNKNATTAPASFHWVISFDGIFSALATLAGAGVRIVVDVADAAALIPEGEAVGDGDASAATMGDGVRGDGEGAETDGAAGAITTGIFCEVVTEAGAGVGLGAIAGTAPVAAAAATALDGDAFSASVNAFAISLPL